MLVAAEFDAQWARQRQPDPKAKPRSHAARARLEDVYHVQAAHLGFDLAGALFGLKTCLEHGRQFRIYLHGALEREIGREDHTMFIHFDSSGRDS